MRADTIPEDERGRWRIEKRTFLKDTTAFRIKENVVLPAGTYTYLFCITGDRIWYPGELVMEDSPFELSTHLEFVMRAHGRVLITGLGLGCVARGLLANPQVDHITCIENSRDVLRMVQPHMPKDDRLEIIKADALQWTAKNRARFDVAWHDLWTNRSNGEPHLDRWHTEIMINLRGKVCQQGAWAYSRTLKNSLKRHGFPWIG